MRDPLTQNPTTEKCRLYSGVIRWGKIWHTHIYPVGIV